MGMMETTTMTDGAAIGVYHAQPVGERRGGLVLVQEIFGITAHIREKADEWAAEGYEVLAPALYDREEPGFEVGYDEAGMTRAVALMKAHPLDQSLADVQACVDALKAAGPVFVLGYCYGGSVAWAAATKLEGIAAASAYYGAMIPKLVDEGAPRVPTIAHFGREDHGIPIDGVEKVIARDLPDVQVFVYEAGHGFNSDRRADYSAPSAALAKQRSLELFRANAS